jgi:hypothetical protein
VLWVCSFLWVFLGFSCGLAELLMCILHVYLEAPYAFLMKFSCLSKKIYNITMQIQIKLMNCNRFPASL